MGISLKIGVVIIATVLCVSACKFIKEKVSFTVSSLHGQVKQTYTFKLPAYTQKQAISDPEGGCEYQFIYADSSLIYITNYTVSPNDENLALSGQDSTKKAYRMSNSIKRRSDTLTLEGKSASGLLWKETIIGDFHSGYKNVPAQNKVSYDNALKMKCRTKRIR